jgi:hypothetical protein
MGRVTDHLVSLIRKQVQDHGVVVWYDPEQSYIDLARALDLPGTTIAVFNRSFFALRDVIEPHLEFVGADGRPRLEAAAPPKVLVYVAKNRDETNFALIEAEAAGSVLYPGANPWQRNTRLKVLAEHVFKDIAPDRVGDIARQAEQGALTLSDLDRLAEQTAELGAGAVKLIYGTASVIDVALLFASSSEHDAALSAKNAVPELTILFSAGLGIDTGGADSPEEVRRRLRRMLLLGDLVASLPPKEVPKELSAVGLPTRPAHLETIRQACRTWRNRADLREAYAAAAREVAREINVSALELQPETLAALETFPEIEDRLLAHAEQRVLDGLAQEALDLAEKRKRSFWSGQEPTNLLRWSLIETASRLLLAAARVRADLKTAKKVPASMVAAYAQGSEPWCLLDTYQRHLERQYATFDLECTGAHDLLEQVIHKARQRYMEVAGLCAESFTAALESAEFEVAETLPQEEIFARVVSPRRASGKVAYVWVDALRFEMGRELVDGLGIDFEVTLVPAIARLPSITEVGMAALVPGAERGMDLVDAGAGKVAIKIGAATLKDRPSRLKHVREAFGGAAVIDLKLNDLIKPSKKLRDEIAAADFVVVTSQEIDRRGEEAEDEDEARRYMDEVLDKLRRGVRRLAAFGVTQIVIAADHGHIFGDAIESGMKIDAPGGKTVDLHRRVWVGKGGTAAEGYVRVPASKVGMGGDLELAFPRGLACFKAGGSTSFFHGAASLQELVIPVATLVAKHASATAGHVAVRVEMERPKITTRFFSVTATYESTGLFGEDVLRVRVVVRGNKKDIGFAAMAAYGFEDGTQEIVLQKGRPNPITLMLPAEVDVKAVSVHVLDAATHVELGRKENIPVAIAV